MSVMSRMRGKAVLVGLIALALGTSALGPCLCLFGPHACHCAAEKTEARPCCQTPAGVAAVADRCCDGGSALVMATNEVPEVGPPVLRSDLVAPAPPGEELQHVAPLPHLPPLSLDRTTVLLI
jgi:hypothetical protein